MVYITWTVGDDFNTIEVVGCAGDPDSVTLERARSTYKEIASIPGVQKENIKVYFQTIDVTFSSKDDAKVFTYLCDVKQTEFAKMRKAKAKRIIKPHQWNGLPFIDEFGEPKGFYFITSKYVEVNELHKKAKQVCKERKQIYNGLLSFYSVFHAA